MDERVPPTFKFTAGFSECCNYLRVFNVYEIPPENQNIPWSAKKPKEDIHLWEIVPRGANYVEGKNLPNITYATVPSGWIQKFPEQGEASALLEGHVYECGGLAVEVPEAWMRFTIRNGKAVRISIPGRRE